jgi:hypothetical protein
MFSGGHHGKKAQWRRDKAREQVEAAQELGEELLLPAAAAVSRETTRLESPHDWSPRMDGARMGDVTGALYTIVWKDSPEGGMHRTEYTFEERWDAEVAVRELEEEYGKGSFDIVTEVPFSAFGLEER